MPRNNKLNAHATAWAIYYLGERYTSTSETDMD